MKSINLTSFFLCVILKIGDCMDILEFPDNGYYERILSLIFEKLFEENE